MNTKLMGQTVNTLKTLYSASHTKQLRQENHLTQEEVFNETNIHVGGIETANSNLSVTTLSTFANFLK